MRETTQPPILWPYAGEIPLLSLGPQVGRNRYGTAIHAYLYLLFLRMERAVRNKMQPDTRSRKESNADVMMDSEPLCTDAYTCERRRRRRRQRAFSHE